ncbi:DUF4340 domain-containing protein [Kaarinaea lacus]
MSPRNLLNIIMLLAVIVLAVIAFYPGTHPEPPPPMVQLLPLSKADIHSLNIHSHDKPVLRFNKEDQHWFMTEPLYIRASDHLINTLLEIVQQPSGTQLAVDKNSLAKYGLDSPRYGLEFNEYPVAIGETDPIHQRRYVMAQDSVYLIEDYFSHLLMEGEGALIDHALLPPGSLIEKLQLPNLTLAKLEGQWQITDARDLESDHYSQDSLQTLIDEWRYGRALTVTLLGEAYEKTSAPTIKVFLKNQLDPIEFYVGQSQLHTLFIRPDIKVRYHLAKDTLQRLTRLTEKTTTE